MHWKPPCFNVPSGKCGKAFVFDLSKLYSAFGSASALEVVALRAATVMPILLLQKTSDNLKEKMCRSLLERRLDLWKNGEVRAYYDEGKVQSRYRRLTKGVGRGCDDSIARSFSNLMFQGKVDAAIQLLSDKAPGKVLNLSDVNDEGVTYKQLLMNKHPQRAPADSCSVLSEHSETPNYDVIFDSIDASLIRKVSLKIKGAAGPSGGLNAFTWKRLCTSFKEASDNLCSALASTARKLSSQYVHPSFVSPFLACRLIALDKAPGVRPIGIGDTARQIIAKAILYIMKPDILDVVGVKQLCCGQVAGI